MTGRYYWVFANITAEYDRTEKSNGFFSVRRTPPASAIQVIAPIYQQMLQIENSANSAKVGEQKSIKFLQKKLEELQIDYQSFVINLFNEV